MIELVTFSNNRRNGDRSYSHGIWQLIGENDSHIAAIAVDDDFWVGRGVQYLNKNEYEHFDAYPLLTKGRLRRILVLCEVGLPAKNPNNVEIEINITA